MIFGNEFSLLILTTGVIRIFFRRIRYLNRTRNGWNGGVGAVRVTSFVTIGLLICLETVLLCTVSDCSKTFQIHWNTSNPIFRAENTDHVISVNRGNAQDYDQVHITCPVYTPGTHDDDAEKYIIYNVSKDEYDSCRITNPSPRIIAICDKPHKLMYYTITFRPFSPQPGGLEFPPGHDYYFISTSSRDDLHRRIGGRCSSDNMKVIFKVCCKPDDRRQPTPPFAPPAYQPPTTHRPPMVWTTHGWTPPPPPPPTSSDADVRKKYAPTRYNGSGGSYDGGWRKPTSGHHPNEVVKNEELTHADASDNANVASATFASPLFLALVYALFAW